MQSSKITLLTFNSYKNNNKSKSNITNEKLQLSERSMCMCIYMKRIVCMCIFRTQVKHLEKKKKSYENQKSYTEDQKSIFQEILQFCCTGTCTIFTLSFHSYAHIPSPTVYDALCTRTSCHFRTTFHFILCSEQFYIENSV